MILTIEGSVEEIAALTLELQGRQNVVSVDEIADSINRHLQQSLDQGVQASQQ